MWWILGGLAAAFLLLTRSGSGSSRPDGAPRSLEGLSDQEMLEGLMQYVVLGSEPASDQRLDLSGQGKSLMTGRDVGDLGVQLVHVHPGPGRAFDPARDNPAGLPGFAGVGHVKMASDVSESGHVGMRIVYLFYP